MTGPGRGVRAEDRRVVRRAEGSAVTSEERTPQSSQRREERHPRALAPTAVSGVARGELAHQQRRLRGFPLWHGGSAEHREMAVEARTRRTAPACDGRHTWPAPHRYLFHVTPHPYESTRPGQGNPIVPTGHSCIAVTGFTFPVRALTTPPRSLSESDRFQGELDNRLAGGLW